MPLAGESLPLAGAGVAFRKRELAISWGWAAISKLSLPLAGAEVAISKRELAMSRGWAAISK